MNEKPQSPMGRGALIFTLVAAVISALYAITVTSGQPLTSLRGDNSLQTIFVPVLVVIGFAGTWFGYRAGRFSQSGAGLLSMLTRDLFARTVTAIAVAVVTYIATQIAFFALDNAFIGGNVQTWLAIIMSGVTGGLWASLVISWAFDVNEMSILQLGLLALYGGMFSSMLIVQDKAWYTESVSFLGGDPNTDMLFNLSVITAGLVVFILGFELPKRLWPLVDAGVMTPWKIAIFQTLIVVISLGIMAVGFFPWGLKPGFALVHDLGSHSMLVIFIVLMFFIRRLIPILDDAFLTTSRIIGVLTLLVAVAMVAGQMYFAVAELLWFILLGAWLYLFLRALLKALAQSKAEHPEWFADTPSTVAMPRSARLLTIIVPAILIVAMAAVSIAGLNYTPA